MTIRFHFGFEAVIVLALVLGAFVSWYAEPTAYDQSTSAQKMEKASELMQHEAPQAGAASGVR